MTQQDRVTYRGFMINVEEQTSVEVVNARINPGHSVCFGNLKVTPSAANATHHSSHRAL